MSSIQVIPPDPFWREIAIAASGELHAEDIRHIEQLLVAAIGTVDAVTLDLAAVTLIDPAARHALDDCRQRFGATGIALRFLPDSPVLVPAHQPPGLAADGLRGLTGAVSRRCRPRLLRRGTGAR